MTLTEALKKIEKCMSDPAEDAIDCLGCPLVGEFKITAGDPHDEQSSITWSTQGCTMAKLLNDCLKKRSRKK